MQIFFLLLFLLICFVAIGAALIALGAGIAYALMYLFSLDSAPAFVAGAVFSVALFHFFCRLVCFLHSVWIERPIAAYQYGEQEEEEEEEEEDEEQPESPIRMLPPSFVRRIERQSKRRRPRPDRRDFPSKGPP